MLKSFHETWKYLHFLSFLNIRWHMQSALGIKVNRFVLSNWKRQQRINHVDIHWDALHANCAVVIPQKSFVNSLSFHIKEKIRHGMITLRFNEASWIISLNKSFYDVVRRDENYIHYVWFGAKPLEMKLCWTVTFNEKINSLYPKVRNHNWHIVSTESQYLQLIHI